MGAYWSWGLRDPKNSVFITFRLIRQKPAGRGIPNEPGRWREVDV